MDQVIKSLDSLYINICVTYASLVFFYFFLSSDSPLGPKSPVHKRILFGILCGMVSAYLDRDVCLRQLFRRRHDRRHLFFQTLERQQHPHFSHRYCHHCGGRCAVSLQTKWPQQNDQCLILFSPR